MNKYTIGLAITLTSVPAYAGCKDAIRKIHQSTVEIAVSLPHDQHAFGSGFFYNNYIITNSHVVNAGSHPVVRLVDGRVAYAKIVADSPKNDIAVLQINGNIPESVQINTNTGIDSRVIAIGNVDGYGLITLTGNIEAYDQTVALPHTTLYDLIQTTIQLAPGASGGPVFNCYGQVVGISDATVSRWDGSVMGFAIPIFHVNEIMAKVVTSIEAPSHSTHHAVTPQPHQPRLGLMVVNSDMTVDRVDPGSPAAAAGVSVGDAIMSLNGQPVRGTADIVNGIQNKSMVTLTVIRNNKVISFRIDL